MSKEMQEQLLTLSLEAADRANSDGEEIEYLKDLLSKWRWQVPKGIVDQDLEDATHAVLYGDDV